jgi:hypothetical protein
VRSLSQGHVTCNTLLLAYNGGRADRAAYRGRRVEKARIKADWAAQRAAEKEYCRQEPIDQQKEYEREYEKKVELSNRHGVGTIPHQ